MMLDPAFLLYGFYVSVFLAALLLVHGFRQLDAARRRRAATLLRRLRDGRAPEAAPESATEAAPGQPGGLRLAHREASGGPHTPAMAARRMARLLEQAGLPYSARVVSLFVAGLTAILTLAAAGLLILSGIAAPWTWLAVPAGLAGGLGLPLACLKHRRARRLGRFAAQLPDALDVMVRSLRAGHPVATAMAMVETDLPEPIAGEFGKAVNEMTYGLDLREALSHLAARVDVEDLRFVVASVGLQHETGGNLAEVLQRLADLMRARFRLTRKVHAHTAEARVSARILAVMPFVFVALVMAANPAIYGEAARDPLFLPVLLAAGGLQVVGILVMRRMAAIRV